MYGADIYLIDYWFILKQLKTKFTVQYIKNKDRLK